MSVTNIYLSRHEDVKELAKRIGKDMGSLDLLTTDDKENIVAAINELKQVQSDITSRIEVLEEHHKKPLDQGPASEYPGTGWYKATDTGVVYNVGVPEGETHIFEGDPIEYISVWRNEGFNPETFEGSADDIQKMIYWHNNLHRFATSNVTDMGHWVYAYGNNEVYGQLGISSDDINTDALNISHYDTSSVVNMQYMFSLASTFNQPLDNFNTSNVQSMQGMFNDSSAFNQDISTWDTRSVITMYEMFRGAEAFNQDISSWNTGNVRDMSNMFQDASSFNQDISSWDTHNVKNIAYMFYKATSFNQDLSGWCVSKITRLPAGFGDQASSWTLPKPVWGTCPRGEDQA